MLIPQVSFKPTSPAQIPITQRHLHSSDVRPGNHRLDDVEVLGYFRNGLVDAFLGDFGGPEGLKRERALARRW